MLGDNRTTRWWIRRWKPAAWGVLTVLAVVGAILMNVMREPPDLLGIATTAAGLTSAFLAGYAILRLLLSGRSSVLGVTRTVLAEAIRMKLVITFLIVMAAVVAGLPFIVGQEGPLHYRVQQFLGYSMLVTGVLLSLITIFIACTTLCGEIEQRQIHTVMTKPIGRGAYLLGKWLGIVLLDGLLLLIAGLTIYGFTMLYLRHQPAQNMMDAVALQEQVLTARVSAEPQRPPNLPELVQQRYEQLVTGQGQAYVDERGYSAVIGEITTQLLTEWRSLGPWGRSLYQRTYVFTGMDRAAQYGLSVQLSYKINPAGEVPDDQTRIGLAINGRVLNPSKQIAIQVTQTELIPVEAITDDGRLEVTFVNLNPYTSISIPFGEGLQLLYKVDSFGPNFARAMLVTWVKLGFLAALGLTMATFLGFPVAALASCLMFVVAAASPWLLEALEVYGNLAGKEKTIVHYVIQWLGTAITVPLSKYGEFRPIPMIVDGQYVGWSMLGGCAAWVGVLWTGAAGLVGWMIFRNRELARVQV